MIFSYVEVLVLFSKLVEVLKNAVHALNVGVQNETLFYFRCAVFIFQYYCHVCLLPLFKCNIDVI